MSLRYDKLQKFDLICLEHKVVAAIDILTLIVTP